MEDRKGSTSLASPSSHHKSRPSSHSGSKYQTAALLIGSKLEKSCNTGQFGDVRPKLQTYSLAANQ